MEQTRTMQPTCTMRILQPELDFLGFGGPTQWRLQQAWLCVESGDLEWRDVETVRVSRREFNAPSNKV